ncbi:MAG: ABC transporter permease, partial [Xanthobacteraceae bacterium]
MAETRSISRSAAAGGPLSPVTLLRIAIVLTTLVIWEALARSGLLYQDVVPSLIAIGKALFETLMAPDYYGHLGVTAAEIATALTIGGLAGMAVGIVLGANRFMSQAFESFLYYLGPTPKIIFFPIMIMWFGVGPGSKVALGTLSSFFPVALSVAAGMRLIDKVLIRVGRSFR